LFHVVAHAVLYGLLAVLACRFSSSQPKHVFAIVLGMGLLQELTQVVGARSFGGPELFDLSVDAAACGAALWRVQRASRSASAAISASHRGGD
jgi:hypothetical protein